MDRSPTRPWVGLERLPQNATIFNSQVLTPFPAPTKGIDVHRHDFETLDKRIFRLNVWDFGGQQIYHATHQFFLTKSSLYVLVDDTRKSDRSVKDDGFKYWLEVVEVLSDHSPVLIFQNEKGGRSKKIDEAGIKRRFTDVKEIYGGDLEERHAADVLRRAIEYHTQRLPHIGEEVPAKWPLIRDAVEERARSDPYISQEDYFDIYREHLEFDRNKALYLSRYLHDLGVFLHFQDDLRLQKTVVLQNRWRPRPSLESWTTRRSRAGLVTSPPTTANACGQAASTPRCIWNSWP
jgi:internalin A